MKHDNVHPRVLRDLTGVVAKPLVIVFEKLQSDDVPNECKTGNITPVFRRG